MSFNTDIPDCAFSRSASALLTWGLFPTARSTAVVKDTCARAEVDAMMGASAQAAKISSNRKILFTECSPSLILCSRDSEAVAQYFSVAGAQHHHIAIGDAAGDFNLHGVKYARFYRRLAQSTINDAINELICPLFANRRAGERKYVRMLLPLHLSHHAAVDGQAVCGTGKSNHALAGGEASGAFDGHGPRNYLAHPDLARRAIPPDGCGFPHLQLADIVFIEIRADLHLLQPRDVHQHRARRNEVVLGNRNQVNGA